MGCLTLGEPRKAARSDGAMLGLLAVSPGPLYRGFPENALLVQPDVFHLEAFVGRASEARVTGSAWYREAWVVWVCPSLGSQRPLHVASWPRPGCCRLGRVNEDRPKVEGKDSGYWRLLGRPGLCKG